MSAALASAESIASKILSRGRMPRSVRTKNRSSVLLDRFVIYSQPLPGICRPAVIRYHDLRRCETIGELPAGFLGRHIPVYSIGYEEDPRHDQAGVEKGPPDRLRAVK